MSRMMRIIVWIWMKMVDCDGWSWFRSSRFYVLFCLSFIFLCFGSLVFMYGGGERSVAGVGRKSTHEITIEKQYTLASLAASEAQHIFGFVLLSPFHTPAGHILLRLTLSTRSIRTLLLVSNLRWYVRSNPASPEHFAYPLVLLYMYRYSGFPRLSMCASCSTVHSSLLSWLELKH